MALRCSFLLCLVFSAALLQAQSQRLTLVPVASGLSQPVLVTNANDGSARLFIVEQVGSVRVLPPGATTPTLFLDISSRVLSGGERGLLGLAFHPQFPTNGRFFVDYTRKPDGATVVAEYRNGLEQRVLFTVPQPYENHNGGMIAFGPDGYLYIGMGDGGSGNDPQNRAQNLNELLGKMLRINVDAPNSRPEIFAYGFRNPWRFSFDRLTGQLYAGDVGQSAREEIDIVTQGGNYGWRVWEGTVCTGLDPQACSAPGFTPPIADYVNTGPDGRCAIIGGYVYRGNDASLPYGAYVFGDLCSGEIFMLKDGVQTILVDTMRPLSSFGEDEAGEIYVVDISGSVFRLANPDAITAARRPYAIANDSAFIASAAGSDPALKVGYGRIQPDAGQPIPSGLSILGFQQRGVLISEASLPASRAILAGRVFAEVGPSVNTGIALTNPNDASATVSFYFTDASGTHLGNGTLTIPAGQHIAAFLNEAPFNETNSIIGTFSFTSSVALAATALRTFTNERGDLLMTALPLMEIGRTPPDNTVIAHFADGEGWTTQVVLVNPSDALISGAVQFIDQAGDVVRTIPYTLSPASATRVVTAGSSGNLQSGSIRISSPVLAFSIFTFRQNGVTLTQAAVPAPRPGTAFRAYIENGGAIRSGVAVANPSAVSVDVTVGIAGFSATLSLPPNGQKAMFLSELPGFATLPASVRGTLQIVSPTPVVVTNLRIHTNERGDFLIIPTTSVNEPAFGDGAAVFFPRLADGDGYSMQFILYGGTDSGSISFFDQAGNATSLQFR